MQEKQLKRNIGLLNIFSCIFFAEINPRIDQRLQHKQKQKTLLDMILYQIQTISLIFFHQHGLSNRTLCKTCIFATNTTLVVGRYQS